MNATPDPTHVLMEEHRVIEKVLACLETMASGAAHHASLDADDARGALDFFRNFADRYHHGKEETELFVMMEEKGMSEDAGPTAQMRHEHEFGRERIRAMADAVDANDLPAFATNAHDYVAMLRDHIQKEDHCLFPMAGQIFSEDELRVLRQRFDKVEADPSMQEPRDRCLATAERLEAKYDPTSR